MQSAQHIQLCLLGPLHLNVIGGATETVLVYIVLVPAARRHWRPSVQGKNIGL